MSRAAAVCSIWLRDPVAWFLGAWAIACAATFLTIAHALAPVLDRTEREGLVLLGLAGALAWMPAQLAATLRTHLGDARERMLPSLAPIAAVAVGILACCYCLPLLVAAWCLGLDPACMLALLSLVGAFMWRSGWKQGRSLVFILPCGLLALPQAGPFIQACLHGGHPLWTGLLLTAAAATVVAAAAASIDDVRADRCRRPEVAHWMQAFVKTLTLPTAAATACAPIGQRTSSWVRHLSRGWRAELAHPLVLVLIAFVGASIAELIAAYDHARRDMIGDCAMLGLAIGLMQWISIMGAVEGAPAARADAARPASRARFATLVLLVAARSLVRSWASLWAGGLAALWLWSDPAVAPRALPFCALNLLLLPILTANLAWILSLRARGAGLATMITVWGVMAGAALPLEGMVSHQWGMAPGAAVSLGIVACGAAACRLVRRRWLRLDLA